MASVERETVVGVFIERDQAEQAMTDLHRAGFNDDQIGFAVRHGHYTEHVHLPEQGDSAKGAAAGAVGGGVLGGVVGAAVALLIPGFGPAIAGGVLGATFGGAALGAATGGFMGAMTSLGLSEEEAHYYQREFETGRVIVTVKAPGRAQEALELLQLAGAYDASTGQGVHAAPGETIAAFVAESTAAPMMPYLADVVSDPCEYPVEASSVPDSAKNTLLDSVVHDESAADRPNRNNIPMGTGM